MDNVEKYRKNIVDKQQQMKYYEILLLSARFVRYCTPAVIHLTDCVQNAKYISPEACAGNYVYTHIIFHR